MFTYCTEKQKNDINSFNHGTTLQKLERCLSCKVKDQLNFEVIIMKKTARYEEIKSKRIEEELRLRECEEKLEQLPLILVKAKSIIYATLAAFLSKFFTNKLAKQFPDQKEHIDNIQIFFPTITLFFIIYTIFVAIKEINYPETKLSKKKDILTNNIEKYKTIEDKEVAQIEWKNKKIAKKQQRQEKQKQADKTTPQRSMMDWVTEESTATAKQLQALDQQGIRLWTDYDRLLAESLDCSKEFKFTSEQKLQGEFKKLEKLISKLSVKINLLVDRLASVISWWRLMQQSDITKSEAKDCKQQIEEILSEITAIKQAQSNITFGLVAELVEKKRSAFKQYTKSNKAGKGKIQKNNEDDKVAGQRHGASATLWQASTQQKKESTENSRIKKLSARIQLLENQIKHFEEKINATPPDAPRLMPIVRMKFFEQKIADPNNDDRIRARTNIHKCISIGKKLANDKEVKGIPSLVLFYGRISISFKLLEHLRVFSRNHPDYIVLNRARNHLIHYFSDFFPAERDEKQPKASTGLDLLNTILQLTSPVMNGKPILLGAKSEIWDSLTASGVHFHTIDSLQRDHDRFTRISQLMTSKTDDYLKLSHMSLDSSPPSTKQIVFTEAEQASYAILGTLEQDLAWHDCSQEKLRSTNSYYFAKQWRHGQGPEIGERLSIGKNSGSSSHQATFHN